MLLSATAPASAGESGTIGFRLTDAEGEPLTDFCDRERLDIRRRLELFAEVCDAVHHALPHLPILVISGHAEAMYARQDSRCAWSELNSRSSPSSLDLRV